MKESISHNLLGINEMTANQHPGLPLVSVALATFNGEKFIDKQINSLLAQDYPNLEIVIADDCSTDDTREKLECYASRHKIIRILPRHCNVGYVSNFLMAFMACNGSLIAPCDQDDIWHNNKISRLVNSMGDASLIYCNSRFIDDSDSPTGKTLADSVTMLSGNDSRSLLFCTSICGHAMLFRSCILRSTSNLSTCPYIDWAIAFAAMEHGYVKYLDEVLVDWRQHTKSLTSYVRDNSMESRMRRLETDESTLKALSSISVRHKVFVDEACMKWEKWKNSYFNLQMFFFALKYGHITHAAHPSRAPALKYLFGHKLKRLLLPIRYG